MFAVLEIVIFFVPPIWASAYDGSPKLVIILVFDQYAKADELVTIAC